MLQRQRVHHRAEHADRIGGGAVETLVQALDAAEEVAAADDDADLDALARGVGDIGRERRQRDAVEAVSDRAGQGFTGELHENALGSHRCLSV